MIRERIRSGIAAAQARGKQLGRRRSHSCFFPAHPSPARFVHGGRTDVLLATGIIEAGLDIPNANTMLVWRPDRFGLTQLHQLRGRVGRGRARASAFFLTDRAHPISRSAIARLERLAALDRLGAGFAVSAADLDQRGAGDPLSERQAGHVRLIGSELYGHQLGRAIAAARGQPTGPEWVPEIGCGVAAFIPDSMVAEADLRLDLYRRLGRLHAIGQVDDFAEELDDRFGELPPSTCALLDLARLRIACRELGLAGVRAGPQAVALEPRLETNLRGLPARLSKQTSFHWNHKRLVLEIAEPNARRRLARLLQALAAWRSLLESSRQCCVIAVSECPQRSLRIVHPGLPDRIRCSDARLARSNTPHLMRDAVKLPVGEDPSRQAANGSSTHRYTSSGGGKFDGVPCKKPTIRQVPPGSTAKGSISGAGCFGGSPYTDLIHHRANQFVRQIAKSDSQYKVVAVDCGKGVCNGEIEAKASSMAYR